MNEVRKRIASRLIQSGEIARLRSASKRMKRLAGQLQRRLTGCGLPCAPVETGASGARQPQAPKVAGRLACGGRSKRMSQEPPEVRGSERVTRSSAKAVRAGCLG